MSKTNQQHYDYLFKLVIIGDSGVGKTNLLSRFSSNQFSLESRPTIGVEFATKTICVGDKKIKSQIWDTAGQERFRAITHAYYKGATGAFIVYDVTKTNTFENVDKWLKQLKQNASQDIIIMLIGNKCDLNESRTVKEDEASAYATQNKLFFMETSAMQSKNVDNAFVTVIQQIHKQISSQQDYTKMKLPTGMFIQTQKQVKIQNPKKKKKESCC